MYIYVNNHMNVAFNIEAKKLNSCFISPAFVRTYKLQLYTNLDVVEVFYRSLEHFTSQEEK